MEDISRPRCEYLYEPEPLVPPEYVKPKKFDQGSETRRRLPWAVIVPWVLSGVLLGGIFVQASILANTSRCYWAGNELEIASREVSAVTKRIRFTGGLRYNESKQLYRQIEPGIPDYAGFPTPDIDAAWKDIISTTDIFMTEKEVQENINNGGTFADLPEGDRLYTDPFTGLYQSVCVVGAYRPFVFHDLHCLDQLRRAVYTDYYPEELTDIYWAHVRLKEHCIDNLRQSIMCYGDLTPIPEAYTDFMPDGHLEPIFQIHHSCRDFNAIQKWAKERDSTDETHWRKNAERLRAGVSK